MNSKLNYIVIEGVRYDFVCSDNASDPCENCALASVCSTDNPECEPYLGRFDTTGYHFVKHVDRVAHIDGKLLDMLSQHINERRDNIRQALAEPGIVTGKDRALATARYEELSSLLSSLDKFAKNTCPSAYINQAKTMTREEANRLIEKHCPCWPNCSKACDDCVRLSMLITYGFTDFYGVVVNGNGEALEDKED